MKETAKITTIWGIIVCSKTLKEKKGGQGKSVAFLLLACMSVLFFACKDAHMKVIVVGDQNKDSPKVLPNCYKLLYLQRAK
jgi:hypothetical protein